MPRILAASSALPPHVATQEEIREGIRRLFAGRLSGLDEAIRVFANARVERRQFVRPLDWYLVPRSPAERNRVYREEGIGLLEGAARRCLEKSPVPNAPDLVIFVSSTGLATPTLDSILIQRLALSPRTARLPVWGLGCAGGAAGLSRAFDYCRAHPRAVVLLTALELCSLTFMQEDVTKKNLVGTAIFADGAAAVLVAGDGVAAPGPRIVASRSHLFPETGRIMGWDILDGGMQLVLSPRLPALVREALPGLLDAFLAEVGVERREIVHYLTHPGGARVIDAYREALALTDELALTERLLARHGNLSSVSVLQILESWMAGETSRERGYGILSAFGPGFSAEMLLLEVDG